VGVGGNNKYRIRVGSDVHQIVMGAIIVVAVAYDVFSKRGKAKTTILKSDAKGETVPPSGGATAAPPGGARTAS
jgi:inositol transport system permease protein